MINAGLMTRVDGDLGAPSYYIVGPPAMVEAVQEMLRTAGVGEDKIRTEEFYGHSLLSKLAAENGCAP